MKKSLLTLSAALFASLAASASAPMLLEGAYANGISPNGEWGVNANGFEIAIVNLKTGEQTVLEETGLVTPPNCISNNGTLVFTTDMDVPYVAINGELKEFDCSSVLEYNIVYLNGISSDGKYIVGSFSPAESRGAMTGFPVFWEIDAEGNVLKATELPYPTVDFAGDVPQRCNALAISDDGKTIVGNLEDGRGMMPQPIVYTLGADGEWSYSLPASKLINPDNIEFPELAPEPTRPDALDYMTEEERAEYQAAYDAYWAGTSEDYPQYSDFMTEEEIAAFEADAEVYNEWLETYLEFLGVYDEIMEQSVNFVSNSVFLSPDGKTLVASANKIIEDPLDPWNVQELGYAVSVDMESEEVTVSQADFSVYPNQVINGGIILATDRSTADGLPQIAYIKDGPDAEFVSLYDYYQENNPELAEWMEENWHKEYEMMNWMTWETETVEGIFTGLTYMSADGATQFSGVITYAWDEENDFVSYIVQDALSGLGKVSVGDVNLSVSAARGGIINIAGDATRVTVYDLSGREVFSAPAAVSVATGLSNGAYIVKVDSANGTKTAKVAF